MAIRSVDEIINLSDSSKNPEKLAFKDLIKHIDPRIRDRAPRHTSLHFNIPGILWGQPVFDAKRVEKMIIRHYKSIGFTCVRLAPREIIIKWGDASDDDDSQAGSHPDDDSDGDTDTDTDTDGGTDGGTDGDTDTDTDTDGDTGTETASSDEAHGARGEHKAADSSSETETSSSGTTDSDDGDGDDASKTKCVTVEQLPLSKRLSIINNQLHQDM